MTDAEKLITEGRECFRKKEYDLAIDFMNKAIELREKAGDVECIDDNSYDHADYYKLRASFYYEKGYYDSAFADYTKAIELNDVFSYNSYHFRAKINFHHKKDYDSAIADCAKTVEFCGIGNCKGCADILYMQGLAYLEKGDSHSAVESLEKALEHNPNLDEAKELKRKLLGNGKVTGSCPAII